MFLDVDSPQVSKIRAQQEQWGSRGHHASRYPCGCCHRSPLGRMTAGSSGGTLVASPRSPPPSTDSARSITASSRLLQRLVGLSAGVRSSYKCTESSNFPLAVLVHRTSTRLSSKFHVKRWRLISIGSVKPIQLQTTIEVILSPVLRYSQTRWANAHRLIQPANLTE